LIRLSGAKLDTLQQANLLGFNRELGFASRLVQAERLFCRLSIRSSTSGSLRSLSASHPVDLGTTALEARRQVPVAPQEGWALAQRLRLGGCRLENCCDFSTDLVDAAHAVHRPQAAAGAKNRPTAARSARDTQRGACGTH
jgi:hypothetical protein